MALFLLAPDPGCLLPPALAKDGETVARASAHNRSHSESPLSSSTHRGYGKSVDHGAQSAYGCTDWQTWR